MRRGAGRVSHSCRDQLAVVNRKKDRRKGGAAAPTAGALGLGQERRNVDAHSSDGHGNFNLRQLVAVLLGLVNFWMLGLV